jgi:phage-related protein
MTCRGCRRTCVAASAWHCLRCRPATTPSIAKPLKGFGGAGVLELMEDDAGGTYRAVYTVRYTTAVYVLHVFQKKSKRGRATPQSDIDLVELRLKRAAALHATTSKES